MTRNCSVGSERARQRCVWFYSKQGEAEEMDCDGFAVVHNRLLVRARVDACLSTNISRACNITDCVITLLQCAECAFIRPLRLTLCALLHSYVLLQSSVSFLLTLLLLLLFLPLHFAFFCFRFPLCFSVSSPIFLFHLPYGLSSTLRHFFSFLFSLFPSVFLFLFLFQHTNLLSLDRNKSRLFHNLLSPLISILVFN